MMDRDKIIRGLEEFKSDFKPFAGNKADWHKVDDALAMLKRSFTPEEVYRTVIEYGQHDRRFRLGDAINYSFSEAVDILRIELMCKAGDV